MSRPRIGGLRTRLWAVVAVAAVLALAAIVVIFNLVLSGRLSADAQSILRSRASGVVAGLRVVDGRLKVTESPDDAAVDTQVWVFAGTVITGPWKSFCSRASYCDSPSARLNLQR